MAVPNKSGKDLITYNCKNGVYSVDGETVKPLGYLSAVNLERNATSKDIPGDGETQATLMNDRGGTGTLELTTRDDDFELDLGFLKKVTQGLAEVQILENKVISIGFEAYVLNKQGVTKTKKMWLLGVTVSPAGDSLAQTTTDINESPASYGINITGTNLMDQEGSKDYVDSNGNTMKVFRLTRKPGEPGYDTFLDSVPKPTAEAE